ncbi:hypothetical protein HN954_03515 [bacterium]|jgi:hypothetical protein|nr:hypothetical protein [bacterium]MBT6996471.1 hypothetical protein [bacterium]MBT7772511.1 hypothetical protein [bacterium]
MSDHNFEKFLEKNGAKYFLALSIFFYVLGTIIFNLYLRTLGSFEFEVLQLRYMFVGIMFLIVTTSFLALVWAIVQLVQFLFLKPKPEPDLKKLTPQEKRKISVAKNKKKEKLFRRIKFAVILFLAAWTPTYALYVFPQIPAGFGGVKPIVGRLIGDAEEIAKINDMIAFETGVPAEKLPYELMPGRGDLAVGPNVKILDRNKDRIFLLLTKDLYLSSTSNFAKKMIESGEGESLDVSGAEVFLQKPLIVSASKIESVTMTLYEPPKMTTSDDLKIAAKLVVNNPETATAVSAAISEDLPGAGEKFVAAVQKQVAAQQAQPEISIPDPATEISEPSTDPEFEPEPELTFDQAIEAAIEETVDSKFLNFRAQIFNQAGVLFQREKLSGEQNREQRNFLISEITETLKLDFPDAWAQLDVIQNYLITGQREDVFPRKVQRAFQGAESATVVISRLNSESVVVPEIFSEVLAAAFEILEKSDDVDTEENRKFVSRLLADHFNKKAKQYRTFWSDTKYLELGVPDDAYFSNLHAAFEISKNWEELGAKLSEFQTDFDAAAIVEIAPDPEPVEVDESEPPVEIEEVIEEIIPEETEPVGTGISEPAIGVGTSEPEIGIGISEPEVGIGISEPDLGIGTSEPAIGVGTSEPEIGIGTSEPAIGVGTSEPEIGIGTTETGE